MHDFLEVLIKGNLNCIIHSGLYMTSYIKFAFNYLGLSVVYTKEIYGWVLRGANLGFLH